MTPLTKVLLDISQQGAALIKQWAVQGSMEYVCVFCQSEQEFSTWKSEALSMGTLVESTPTGDLTRLHKPIPTPEGLISFVKIRIVDPTRPERGDVDYKALPNWQTVYDRTKDRPGFKLIERPTYKMIELMHPDHNTRAYFSNPSVLECHP